MRYDATKNENVLTVNAKFTEKEWNEMLENSYKKNMSRFNVQGFRKGHVPKSVVIKNYGEQVLYNDAIDEAYYKAYSKALKENKEFRPIAEPKLDIKKIDSKCLEIVLSIEGEPEFELGTYKGLEFKRHHHELDESAIQERIDRDLLRASKLVETNAEIKLDDTVTLDFEGYIDGVKFDGGSAKNYQLKIGSHSFIDNFEEQLIGMKVGDEKDVIVMFPADYHEKSLASKQATFKVKINNVRERIMPVLDDDFVSNNTEFETVDEYKANVLKELEEKNMQHCDIETDNEILDTIVNNTTLSIPSTLIAREKERVVANIRHQLSHQGITLEDYAKYIGRTVDDIIDEQTKNVERQLKGRLVLEKLIRTEKLDITEKEIENKIASLAKERNMSVNDFKSRMGDDGLNSIASELIMSKLIKFLHDNNTIID